MTSGGDLFDVVIIGCGPAGIAAAIDFQTNSSLKFVLLEARDRVGGRAVTDTTTFGSNAPVDVGAQWLHHYRPGNPLHRHHQLSRDLHLDYHYVLRSPTTPFLDVDGTKISLEKVGQAEEIFDRLCSKLKKTSSFERDKSIAEVIQDEYKKYCADPQMKRLIDLFLGFIEQYEASSLDQLSAKCFLKSDNDLEEFNLALPNGVGTFIQHVAHQHQLPVELNCIVTRIESSPSDSMVRVFTKDGRLFCCKFVLVTIPLGCLKHRSIEFQPELPEWKQKAIETMGFGTSDKVVLQFPYVFWDAECTTIFCASPRFRYILCRPDVCILHIKVNARVALEIEEKNEQDTIDEVMVLLRRCFPDRDVPEPSRFLITKWKQDPFARGAYSSFAVGADEQTLVDLARECHERIHWAGEHTNYNGTIGCVDSAFESGQREAKRIVEKLNE